MGLQVSAEDKASGKSQKITITSDKGRLSEEEIERMIQEAEQNAEADREAKEQVEAKNQLEAYLYSLRSSADDTLNDKLDEADRELLMNTVKDGLQWLEDNGETPKGEIDEKRKEVEGIANPIISKAYGQVLSRMRMNHLDPKHLIQMWRKLTKCSHC